jgi:hypothetical protein
MVMELCGVPCCLWLRLQGDGVSAPSRAGGAAAAGATGGQPVLLEPWNSHLTGACGSASLWAMRLRIAVKVVRAHTGSVLQLWCCCREFMRCIALALFVHPTRARAGACV